MCRIDITVSFRRRQGRVFGRFQNKGGDREPVWVPDIDGDEVKVGVLPFLLDKVGKIVDLSTITDVDWSEEKPHEATVFLRAGGEKAVQLEA